MAKLPEVVEKAWENRKGPVVFATVDEKKKPNAVYVGCVKKLGEGHIILADNYFDKTLGNIRQGTYGSVLFITDDRKSYQLKGPVTYHAKGQIFDDMKKWLDPKYPGKGAAAMMVEEIYCGAEKIV